MALHDDNTSHNTGHKKKSLLSPKKARKMLKDGKPLTQGQKGLFRLIAGGGKPTKKSLLR